MHLGCGMIVSIPTLVSLSIQSWNSKLEPLLSSFPSPFQVALCELSTTNQIWNCVIWFAARKPRIVDSWIMTKGRGCQVCWGGYRKILKNENVLLYIFLISTVNFCSCGIHGVTCLFVQCHPKSCRSDLQHTAYLQLVDSMYTTTCHSKIGLWRALCIYIIIYIYYISVPLFGNRITISSFQVFKFIEVPDTVARWMISRLNAFDMLVYSFISWRHAFRGDVWLEELYNGKCIAVVEAIRKNPSFGLDLFTSMKETEQSVEQRSFQLCHHFRFKRKLLFPIFYPKNSHDCVGGSLAYMGCASLTIYFLYFIIFHLPSLKLT